MRLFTVNCETGEVVIGIGVEFLSFVNVDTPGLHNSVYMPCIITGCERLDECCGMSPQFLHVHLDFSGGLVDVTSRLNVKYAQLRKSRLSPNWDIFCKNELVVRKGTNVRDRVMVLIEVPYDDTIPLRYEHIFDLNILGFRESEKNGSIPILAKFSEQSGSIISDYRKVDDLGCLNRIPNIYRFVIELRQDQPVGLIYGNPLEVRVCFWDGERLLLETIESWNERCNPFGPQ